MKKKLYRMAALMMAVLMMVSVTGCALMNKLDEVVEGKENGSTEVSETAQAQESQAEASQEASKEESVTSQEETSQAQDSQQEESKQEESKQEESSKEESKQEESSKEESSKEESSKEESSKEESKEESKAESSQKKETPPALTGDYTGEFVSDTETALNLIVRWAASKNPDTTYTVSLQFFLECYSLEVSERNDNTLTVVTSKGEQSFSFHTDALEKEKDDYSEEYIGKTSFTVSEKDMENGVSVTASWPFRGTYSEKDIPEIKAAGVIKAE